MKKLVLSAVAIIAICNVNAQNGTKLKPTVAAAAVTKPVFKNVSDSFSYALGLSIGESLKQSGVSKINTQLLSKAMNEVLSNAKTLLTKEQANACIQDNFKNINDKKGTAQKQEGKNFLALNKQKKGIIELPNGLQYEVLKEGEANGAKPKVTDTVVVHYVGTLTNGTEFDNSLKRGEPATFPLNGVIRGWTEILQLMPKGANWKVYIPSELAYGANPPSQQIPPNAVLIFEISLLDIKTAAEVTK